MKKKINGLQKLMALALSFSVFACHDPSDLGFGLGADGTINAIFTDTVSVNYSTVLSDSAVNGNANYILSGYANDPELGSVEALAYFQPSLTPQLSSSGTVVTGTDGSVLFDTLKITGTPVIDSLKLRLYCNGLVYGDTNAVSKFKVHRLTDLMQTKNYNGSEKLTYDPTPIAEFQFNLPQLRNDSTGFLTAQFISLPKAIASELITTALEAKGNNKTFISKFKGFAIIPDKSNKAVYAFATGVIDITGANSSVIPYWHISGDTTASLHVFNLNGPRHTALTFDRSKTPLASLSNASNELSINKTGGKLYIQGGSGISTKVDISPLSKLGKIKVVKATLEFQVNRATINPWYSKVYYTVLAETGVNNQQKRTNNKLSYIYGSLSDSEAGSYHALVDSSNYLNVDITKYLQKLEYSGDFNKQLLLLPGSGINTTNGVAILGNDNLSRLVFLKPRLLLYYNKN